MIIRHAIEFESFRTKRPWMPLGWLKCRDLDGGDKAVSTNDGSGRLAELLKGCLQSFIDSVVLSRRPLGTHQTAMSTLARVRSWQRHSANLLVVKADMLLGEHPSKANTSP